MAGKRPALKIMLLKVAKDEKPQAAGSDFRLLSSQRGRIRNVTLIDETQNLMLTKPLVVILLEFF